MSFLLDTNAISEWVKPRPNPGLVVWLAEADEDALFLSVVTLAELRHGIARMTVGARQRRLQNWLRDELPDRFDRRILPIDLAVALVWGDVTAGCAAVGRSIGAMDAFIAATARVHGLKLVTRNVADFERTAVTVLNPWS
jgi:hypothetical protein